MIHPERELPLAETSGQNKRNCWSNPSEGGRRDCASAAKHLRLVVEFQAGWVFSQLVTWALGSWVTPQSSDPLEVDKILNEVPIAFFGPWGTGLLAPREELMEFLASRTKGESVSWVYRTTNRIMRDTARR